MTPESSPRRRLDVEERRAAILAAARATYAGQGYGAVSTAQLAAASGTSQGLLFHYFGSKAGLYAAVVAESCEALARAQAAAAAAIPEGAPVRDRVRGAVHVALDHVAAHPQAWAATLDGGDEPPEAVQVRREAREREVEALRALLGTGAVVRHGYALWGFFGFLDQACLRWAADGCPEADRHSLVEAALGCLQGALGDWGR